MLKVGFLGNCQAQCLETWVRQLPEEVAVRISDDFTLPDLSTSRLKAQFGDKIVSWPNAYFDGYFPGISYRYSNAGKLLGPLDEYHWDMIDESWRSGFDVAQCVDRLTSEAVFERYPQPIGESLRNLAEREVGLDTIISDYVASMLNRNRLFYSMNHPVNELLLEMLHRLFGLIGERRRLAGLGDFGYPLNKIILPVLPAIFQRFQIKFDQEAGIKGVEVQFADEEFSVSSQPKIYSYADLVECFYRIYDLNSSFQ
ncbi:WcbI family polysaccharide biosynthesis putative acetyltransferase [Sphingomonas sp. 28-63-12]|uniref:WcbI family polysaccharide biosynthesis putative acetyltransferase n=1 Tax=Sphingomonas sp. 28-63-12 TaxID=1970434 RepID=UPI000BD9FA0F|nr:MAG: hypothetical protein B7Y47_13920 [Sphingomonas sp. 28-63-12]